MRIINRRAPYGYKLLGRIEAGISLTGNEVKSIKTGRVDLSTGLVRIKDGQVSLFNANIPPYQGGTPEGYNPTRVRKLLLTREEILRLATKAKQQKLTIVPTKMYTKGRWIKIELALARPKRKFEKREVKREKDLEREIERELKTRG